MERHSQISSWNKTRLEWRFDHKKICEMTYLDDYVLPHKGL